MKKIFYLFMTLLLLAGCEPDSVEESNVFPEMQQEDVTAPEQNVVGGELTYINVNGNELPVQEVDGAYLFEGDIMIPKNFDKSTDKAAAITEPFWWEDNTIVYTIDPSAPNTIRINAAIAHWEANTNVKFVKRTNETDYVAFVGGNGCSSYVGQIGGRQNITLSAQCSTGNIIHEIGHAAGLWHEQSRMDRDDYIDILWENISDAAKHNFQTYNNFYGNGIDMTPTLDFGSIMMYSPYSFSINGQPTIVKNDGTLFSVQRDALSAGDLYAIDIMYPAAQTNPDRDGDGVLNENDECPDEAVEVIGTYTNDGCPWSYGYHTLYGVTVYKTQVKWYWYSKGNGWKQVYYEDENWYIATTGTLVEKDEPEETEYENGKYYTIAGLQVYRSDNKWYWYSKYGWKQVKLENGRWYYV